MCYNNQFDHRGRRTWRTIGGRLADDCQMYQRSKCWEPHSRGKDSGVKFCYGCWSKSHPCQVKEDTGIRARERRREVQANGYAVTTTKPYNRRRAPMRSSCSNITTSAKVALELAETVPTALALGEIP